MLELGVGVTSVAILFVLRSSISPQPTPEREPLKPVAAGVHA